MSKVLVELEIPNGCETCPFYYETEGAFSNVCQHPNCESNDCGRWGEYKDCRPEWCPFNKTEKLTVVQWTVSQMDERQNISSYVLRDYIPLKEENK